MTPAGFQDDRKPSGGYHRRGARYRAGGRQSATRISRVSERPRDATGGTSTKGTPGLTGRDTIVRFVYQERRCEHCLYGGTRRDSPHTVTDDRRGTPHRPCSPLGTDSNRANTCMRYRNGLSRGRRARQRRKARTCSKMIENDDNMYLGRHRCGVYGTPPRNSLPGVNSFRCAVCCPTIVQASAITRLDSGEPVSTSFALHERPSDWAVCPCPLRQNRLPCG